MYVYMCGCNPKYLYDIESLFLTFFGVLSVL